MSTFHYSFVHLLYSINYSSFHHLSRLQGVVIMAEKAQYTVLRIKRKATEAPLSSLGTLIPLHDTSFCQSAR